jgi:Flp pilus assembly CpaF family ATPase
MAGASSRSWLQLADLLARQALTPEMAQFLSACVKARINDVGNKVGGTSS